MPRRDALHEGFNVRLGVPQDAEGVSTLISGMPNSAEIRELFSSALERHTAVVAVVKREVVGLVTISDRVDVPLLRSHFHLQRVLHLASHPDASHGEVDMVCMNPIFAHHARALLSGAQRLLRKSVLHYALPPNQPPPEALDVMAQVPPRRTLAALPPSSSPQQQQSESGAAAPAAVEFALYAFTRRLAFVPRQAVNAQLVVVGASEAGVATVERLLMDTRLLFTHITLLAPGGIPVAGLANHYTPGRARMNSCTVCAHVSRVRCAEALTDVTCGVRSVVPQAGVLAKLGMDARANVLDVDMVGLDTANRVLDLSDGSQLPYDLLLITSGLQEPTLGFVVRLARLCGASPCE